MITKDTFKKLVLALAEHGISESKVIDSIEYKAYKSGELTLILSKVGTRWTPEGIQFELLGSEFFITSDGSVTISEDEDDDADVYLLNDTELIAVVASFLKWRLSVLNRLKV